MDVYTKQENGTWKKDVKASTTTSDRTITIEGLAENTEIKIEVTPKVGTKIMREGALEAVVTTGSNEPTDEDGSSAGEEENQEHQVDIEVGEDEINIIWDAFKDADLYKVTFYQQLEDGTWKKGLCEQFRIH